MPDPIADPFAPITKRGVSIADSEVDAQDIVGRDKIDAQTVIQNLTVVAQPSNQLTNQPSSFALRILTIVARPLNVRELPDIADAWALVDGFAKVEAPIFMRILEPPTIETLRAALADDWDVVHFDGHGAATDEHGEPVEPMLAFERDDGTLDALAAHDFAEMLSLSGHMPRLVVLSACESARGENDGLAGELLRAGVPAVLGTRESVTVDWTMALVRPLYAQLARGRTIQQAFDAARPALRAVPNPISQTPSFDLAALLGVGVDEWLCDGAARGKAHVERALLVGWTEPWHGAFHGDYFEPHPERHGYDAVEGQPQGRKGLIVQAARALLRGEKLVALTGVGGIGKTALAAATARRMAWRFPGGVFWIDGRDYLTSRIPLDAVLDPFAQLFGADFLKLPTARKRELVRAYMNQLEHACLIVLDNADVASEEALRFVSELPPRSAALLTTRDVPESRGVPIALHAMSPHESLRFLVDEIGRRMNDPHWYVNVGAQHAVPLQEIARLLDGHPLALLQAAALVASEGVRDALARVQAHPAQGKELRQRFDFSCEPLGDAQKKLLHRLAAFATDCDEQALDNLCMNEHFAPSDAQLPYWESDWRALRDKSLVEMLPSPKGRGDGGEGDRRLRLHPVMRDYVRQKAGDAAMRAEDQRAAQYFVALARWGAQQLNSPETALQAVQMADVERLNLLAAQGTCMAQGAWDDAVSLAYDLGDLFERTGHWGDRRRALQAGIEAAKQGNDLRQVALLANNLGIAHQDSGSYQDAKQWYEQSLRGLEAIHEEKTAPYARALHELGNLAYLTGDYGEARRLYAEAAQTFKAIGAQREQASVLHQQGVLAQDTGDYGEARRLYAEAAQTFKALGAKSEQAAVLHQLGVLAQATGDYAEARRLYDESLVIKRALGNQAGVAITLAQLSLLEEQEGNIGRALELIRTAEQMFTQLGCPMREQARKDRERLERKLSADG